MQARQVDTKLVTEEKPAAYVINFWLKNLDWIKDTIAKGSDYLNLASVGTYALAEAISHTLFEKNSRHYFEKELNIEHAHLMYEAFRNGFTHAFKPNDLHYEGAYVSWAWHSDTSPSGFRPFYFGEKDPDTGDVLFEADKITEYIRFSDKFYQISVRLDRLVARIEADLLERKSKYSNKDTISQVIGKKFSGSPPSGAINADIAVSSDAWGSR